MVVNWFVLRSSTSRNEVNWKLIDRQNLLPKVHTLNMNIIPQECQENLLGSLTWNTRHNWYDWYISWSSSEIGHFHTQNTAISFCSFLCVRVEHLIYTNSIPYIFILSIYYKCSNVSISSVYVQKSCCYYFESVNRKSCWHIKMVLMIHGPRIRYCYRHRGYFQLLHILQRENTFLLHTIHSLLVFGFVKHVLFLAPIFQYENTENEGASKRNVWLEEKWDICLVCILPKTLKTWHCTSTYISLYVSLLWTAAFSIFIRFHLSIRQLRSVHSGKLSTRFLLWKNKFKQ